MQCTYSEWGQDDHALAQVGVGHSSQACYSRQLGLSTLASRRKLHNSVTMFNCMSSKSPPYLSQLFFFAFIPLQHPSTSSSQLNLSPIVPPSAKCHSVSWAQHCGDPCHRTSKTLETSLGTTHFASDISINDI